MNRLGLAVVMLATALFASGAMAETAADYPTRPVRIVVPFGAGGPADITARLVGKFLQDRFKQPFVVDNRPGAGGVIGTVEVARAAPDGYTLLMMSNTQTANETLLPNRNYQLMRDFVAVAPANSSDLVIVVNPAVPAKTLQELIALAKQQPGKLNYASSGQGTPYHMAGELFKAMTGTDIVHVPHRNSGEARADVIAGQVEMMIDAITTMAPNIVAGQVRALAGTPPAIVAKLNAAITEVATQPDITKMWAQQGAVPMTMSTSEFDAYLRGDIAKWHDVAQKFVEKTQ